MEKIIHLIYLQTTFTCNIVCPSECICHRRHYIGSLMLPDYSIVTALMKTKYRINRFKWIHMILTKGSNNNQMLSCWYIEKKIHSCNVICNDMLGLIHMSTQSHAAVRAV